MYAAVLLLHSWLRWLVIVSALIAVVRALAGASLGRPWVRADDVVGKLFLHSVNLQFLLGLLLYFILSPVTRTAMSDFGAAMRDSVARFWAVEHVIGMLIGVALAHVGRKRAVRAQDHPRRHKVTAIFFALALISMLVSIPWPGRPGERPLFRWWP